MRRILIDRTRYPLCQRRECENNSIQLEDGLLLEAIKPAELRDLDDASSDLESYDSELAEVAKQYYRTA